MLLMGLDTALQRCSVAILKDGAALADEGADMERGHAERLAPMAAAALSRAGVRIGDLDRIGVVVGPGGFTGVRVALSFARGLAVGTGVTVIGLTSLAALAGNVENHDGKSLIAAIIDARRSQVYAALYEGGEALVEPFVAAPEQALRALAEKAAERPVLTVGTGAALLPAPPADWRASGAPDQIDARVVARLAAVAPAPAGPARPLYLRPPDAKPARPSAFDGVAR